MTVRRSLVLATLLAALPVAALLSQDRAASSVTYQDLLAGYRNATTWASGHSAKPGK